MATPYRRPTPYEILTAVAELSGIPLKTLQSPTQLRSVGRIRTAAAHLLRADAGLQVKEVAPLLGRSDQTVCEFGRKARVALASGGEIAQLIEQARKVLAARTPGSADFPNACGVSLDEEPSTLAAVSPPDVVLVPRLARQPPKPTRGPPVPYLAEWRQRAGPTQAHLAQRAGLARETIVRAENGRSPRPDVIVRLAEALVLAPSMLTGTAELDTLTDEAYLACTSCGAFRPVRGFVAIRGTSYFHRRCRACRAKLVQVGGREPGLMGKPGKMRHPELTGMDNGHAETSESGVE